MKNEEYTEDEQKIIKNKNIKDKDGKTALHLAIENKQFDIAKKLLDHNYFIERNRDEHTNVNIQDKNGDTALHLALTQNPDAQIIEKLINYKPWFQRTIGITRLEGVIEKDGEIIEGNGTLETKELEINYDKNDAINLELKNKKGETPLHVAIANRSNDSALKLIEKNVNVNAKNNLEKTPLHYAAEHNASDEVLESLIKHGADINAKDISGKTALHYACKTGSKDVANLIMKNGDQITDLNKGEVTDKDKKFTDLNIQDKDGNTALHLALNNKKYDIAKKLINYTPSITVKERNIENKHLFDQFKADLTLQNKEGNTPLMLAVKNGDKDLVELIINNIPAEKLNAMLNMRNKDRKTTYSLANNDEVREILQTKGVYVNINLEDLKAGSDKRKIQDKVNIISNKANIISDYLGEKGKKSALDIVQNDANLLDKDLKKARNKLGKEIRSKRLKEFLTSGKISNDDVKKLKEIQKNIDKARTDITTQINSVLKNKGIKTRI